MHEKYLGDSYDILKRFWAEKLREIAPLYAHSRFLPENLGARFERLTIIPTFRGRPAEPFALLLDPDTGIPLPGGKARKATHKHAPLDFIVELHRQLSPAYVICFDQSHCRTPGLSREEQRRAKMRALRERGVESFYYVSHAPFLFSATVSDTLSRLRNRLLVLGILACRLVGLADAPKT